MGSGKAPRSLDSSFSEVAAGEDSGEEEGAASKTTGKRGVREEGGGDPEPCTLHPESCTQHPEP